MALSLFGRAPAAAPPLPVGLLALFVFAGLLPSVALKADPIVFQATNLDSNACFVDIVGQNFEFTLKYPQSSCGGRPASVGVPFAPLPVGSYPGYNEIGIAVGYDRIPGISDRVAIAYGGGQPSLYKDPQPTYVPEFFAGPIPINVVLSGTLQVCLEPADVQTPGQVVACDPAYADIGTVNINVAGQAVYTAQDGYIGARDFAGFRGTSAAAPEPSQLGMAGGTALLICGTVSCYRRRRTERR